MDLNASFQKYGHSFDVAISGGTFLVYDGPMSIGGASCETAIFNASIVAALEAFAALQPDTLIAIDINGAPGILDVQRAQIRYGAELYNIPGINTEWGIQVSDQLALYIQGIGPAVPQITVTGIADVSNSPGNVMMGYSALTMGSPLFVKAGGSIETAGGAQLTAFYTYEPDGIFRAYVPEGAYTTISISVDGVPYVTTAYPNEAINVGGVMTNVFAGGWLGPFLTPGNVAVITLNE